MKLLRNLIIIFTALAFVNIAGASKQAEVALRNYGDLEILLRGGFDVVDLSRSGMATVILPDEAERALLNGTGLPYFISNHNLEAYFAERLAAEMYPRRDLMGGYRTYDEIVDELIELHEDYPDIVSEIVSIGESIEEREIWAVKISDNPEDDEDDEPEVLLTALIHAREVITDEVLFNFIYYLVENYGEDERVTSIVDEREIWIIPCHNPDGYVWNEEIRPDGGGMWRKNRRRNHDDSWGVDLNRNWGYMWGFDNQGSSNRPSSNTYRGTGSFSEPETQAAREFINNHDFGVTIYFHSWGNLILYPFGYDYLQPEHRSLLNAMGQSMAVDSDYLIGTAWEIIYLTNGDSDDWIYMSDEHEQIMPFTIEVGNNNDNFWPPRRRVEPLVSENLEACMIAAEYCDEPARILRPPQPTGVTAITDHQGNVVVSWDDEEDEINPAVNYQIRAFIPDEPFYDEVDEDQEIWKQESISISERESHSDPFSYRIQTTGDMCLLTLNEEIQVQETFWAWINFNLRSNYHYVALEVSYDGYDWVPVSGEHTENLVMNEHNLGPGVSGNTDGWMRTNWNIEDYAGEMVRLRFRYYRLDHSFGGEFGYIDDIGPLPAYEWREILVEDIENLVWIDEEHGMDDGLFYQVQAVDAEGDLSFWSLPVAVEEGPSLFTIPISLGWSIISLPLEPLDCNLYSIFRPLIEKDVQMLVKDEWGRFFAPRHYHNGIGDWDPLHGYQVMINQTNDLPVEGYYLEEDTPIPLDRGWHIVSYLPQRSMPAEEAFASIDEDNLVLVKDGDGNFWLPEWEFNNLPHLHRSAGYYLYVLERDTLVYPAGDRRDSFVFQETAGYHNDFISQSPDNHSLLLLFDEPLQTGILSLVDHDGNTCGLVRTGRGQTSVGVAAWGETEDDLPGYSKGEKFIAFWRDEIEASEKELTFTLIEGDPVYKVNGISVLAVSIAEPGLPVNHGIVSASPNPFNSSTRLAFDLAKPSRVNLKIYDASGRLVDDMGSRYYSTGSHRVPWNAYNRSSGLYLARLEVVTNGKSTRSQAKLLIVR